MNPLTAFCKLQLRNAEAEGLTPAELRQAKRQAMARLQEAYIPARFSLDEPTVIVLGVPVERKRLRQVLDGLGDLWVFTDGEPLPMPLVPRHRGKWCLCGRRLSNDSVTGRCARCLGYRRAAVCESPTPEQLRHREMMRLSRYKQGRTCSMCARPILDDNKSGVCQTCRTVDGDPQWEQMVADAAAMPNSVLRARYAIGEKKLQAVRAEARRRKGQICATCS